MSEVDPLMLLMFQQHSFAGIASADVEQELMPLDAQLFFGPGDVAMMAASDTMLDSDFTLIQAVDPAQFAETYPDWEERLLNSYVLCNIFSRDDPIMHLGWVSRVKVLPISSEHYEEALTWLEKGFPMEAPDWTLEYFRQYTDALSERAPGLVPKAVTCIHCESREVELIVKRNLTYTSRAGVILIEGVERHIPLSEVQEASTHTAQLHCTNCHASADLSDDEWQLPNITR